MRLRRERERERERERKKKKRRRGGVSVTNNWAGKYQHEIKLWVGVQWVRGWVDPAAFKPKKTGR